MTYDSAGQAGVQHPKEGNGGIKVTEEMIRAGVLELMDHRFSDPLSEVIEDVYRAMAYVARSAACSSKS